MRPTGLLDPIIEVRPVATQVDDVLSEIHKRVALDERVLITTLTKRMAEDLSEYLNEHGVKVRYLHSDIDTVERIEIIRDLRIGKFDVLVGINLLREGLDMPEVSLVAILDADKEGFLRAERSLIQTIGRAARHINGRAILYGDKITKSMKKAMDETERRREKQIEHNKANNITPMRLNKPITDIMDLGEGAHPASGKVRLRKVEEKKKQKKAASATELMDQIAELEKQMFEYARELEFEKAASLRDDVEALRKQVVALS